MESTATSPLLQVQPMKSPLLQVQSMKSRVHVSKEPRKACRVVHAAHEVGGVHAVYGVHEVHGLHEAHGAVAAHEVSVGARSAQGVRGAQVTRGARGGSSGSMWTWCAGRSPSSWCARSPGQRGSPTGALTTARTGIRPTLAPEG